MSEQVNRSEAPTPGGVRSSEAGTARAVLDGSLESLPDSLSRTGNAVITTDAHGRITFLNPLAQTLTGWTQPEAVSKSLERVFRIVGEETRQALENPALRAIGEGHVVSLVNQTVLIAKDGTEQHIEGSSAPIRDVNDAVAGAVLVFREAGERRQPQQRDAEELAYAQALLSTFPSIFLVLDGDLRVKSANASFYLKFQATEEETVGHVIYDLGNGQWNIPALRTMLEEVIPVQDAFEGLLIELEFPKIASCCFRVSARRIRNAAFGG